LTRRYTCNVILTLLLPAIVAVSPFFIYVLVAHTWFNLHYARRLHFTLQVLQGFVALTLVYATRLHHRTCTVEPSPVVRYGCCVCLAVVEAETLDSPAAGTIPRSHAYAPLLLSTLDIGKHSIHHCCYYRARPCTILYYPGGYTVCRATCSTHLVDRLFPRLLVCTSPIVFVRVLRLRCTGCSAYTLRPPLGSTGLVVYWATL